MPTFDIAITPQQKSYEAGERDAYSIVEFCRRNGFSVSFHHKLQRQGIGPKLMRLGARTLVTVEASDTWRREREAATVNTCTEAAAE
jgi:hypothetical protein